MDITALREEILKIENVLDVHHIHIWTLDGEKNMATLHVSIDENADIQSYKKIKARVQDISVNAGIEHLTIQIDVQGDCFMDNCGL